MERKVIEVNYENKQEGKVKKVIKGIGKFSIKVLRTIGFVIVQLVEFISVKSLKRYEDKTLDSKLKATKFRVSIILILIVALVGSGIKIAFFSPTTTEVIGSNSVKVISKNEIAEVKNVERFGDVTTKINIDEVDPAYEGKTFVRYTDSDGKNQVEYVKCYGIGRFTVNDNCRSVENFVNNYLKEIDSDMYNKYFTNSVQGAGTYNFDTAWQECGRSEKEKFLKYQFDYIYQAYVKPTADAVNEKYNIDILSTDAGKEFIYSMSEEFGTKATLAIFDKAGVESGMGIKDIISKVQGERKRSVGIYTYTKSFKYDDEDRQNAINRIEKQTKEFEKLLK